MKTAAPTSWSHTKPNHSDCGTSPVVLAESVKQESFPLVGRVDGADMTTDIETVALDDL